MEEFSFRRDFKFVLWPATMKLNLIRAAISGLIWGVFGIVMALTERQASGSGQVIGSFLLMLIGWPIGYLFFGMPIGIACSWLSEKGVPFVGWVAIIFAIAIVVADPFMYVLHKKKPELVPVENYGIFNFRLVIFVLDSNRLS